MKTDKFEKTIRQKLESISPDFQEDNWAQMQRYMQTHTPPTFWQQYGSWLGYAAAASITTVMAFLYSSQLSKNDKLATDLSQLKNQIEVLNTKTLDIPKTDTVYIVQKEVSREQFLNQQLQRDESSQFKKVDRNEVQLYSPNQALASSINNHRRNSIDFQDTETDLRAVSNNLSVVRTETDIAEKHVAQLTESNQLPHTATAPPAVTSDFTKVLDEGFQDIQEIKTTPLLADNNRNMHYKLSSRLTPRKARQVWLASTSTQAVRKVSYDSKKVDKADKSENIIPQLNIKAPYRFGVGYQFEGNNQVKTVVGEVLVAKKFSISAGLSWLRIKPLEFINEKVFRDKNRMDFRRTHPGDVPPMGFEIANIQVKPTLVQIPLTVAFRNDITKDFSYYVGAGTNVTVKAKNDFSFECRLPMPGKEFQTQSFDRKMNLPLFNSVNVTAGIEKSWHPIVIQVEGYLYTYFKALTPENQKTGPGVKVKLLYQIGNKM